MDSAQWLADYGDRLANTAARARAAEEDLRTAGGSARSPRGEVTVTVNAGGVLQGLTLTPAARSMEVDALARLILDTAGRAQRAAGERVAGVLREHLGDFAGLDLVTEYQGGAR